jgi:hypothetical protein
VNKGNAGQIHENNAMQQSNPQWAKQIPDSLNFSQEQVTFILGHSLRSLYNDVLATELPDRLRALVQELENKQTPASDAR